MSPNLKSDQDSVEANILALAQDLLSRDPTRFNSCINHNFESQSTYKGHGVELKGVSNIKHAATLFNTLDGGKAAVVKRENIAWDPESTTATIHSIRFLRPIFSPITFSLPIKTVLRFNSEDVPDVDGSNTKASKIPGESLFVTSFEDEWPIEGLVRKIPVVRSLFKSLYVPIFTFFVLTLANLVFSIQSRFTTQFHSPKAHDLTRKANKLKFKVPAPVAFKEGFEVGKNSTDKLIKGTYSKGSQLIRPPLRFLEFGLQKSTNLVNFLLPTGLIQLPWPSILEENSVDPRVDLGGGEKKEKEKEKGKERSGPSDFASALKNAENSTPSTSKKESTPAPSEKEQEEEKNVPPAQDTTEPTTTTTTMPNSIPTKSLLIMQLF